MAVEQKTGLLNIVQPVNGGELLPSNHDLPFSQGTDYGEDISSLILQVEETSHEVGDAHTTIRGLAFSSSDPLAIPGKRKASDLLEGSTSESNRPAKICKSDEGAKSLSNPNDANEPYIITHSPFIQQRFADGIPIGVQWEVARLVSLGKIGYEDVTNAGLDSLRGNNVEKAPETAKTFVRAEISPDVNHDPAFSQENAARSPWKELDMEETALAKDEFAALGHSASAPYEGWYGGKLQFLGKLQRDQITGSFKIVLERCTVGSSCRFTRRFGSRSFLRIKIPARLLHSNSGLPLFFRKAFILWGRVFRAFYAKDETVFMYRTTEIFEESCIRPAQYNGMSLWELIQWHNPLEFNNTQKMAKWAARFALGLSNSYPGPVIAPENILHEDDIVSSTGEDMTDGCGSSNKSVHKEIHYALNCEVYPIAVQFRLEGCKGMTAQRPDTLPDEPLKVWLRPSQRKIKYPPEQPRDPAHLIMDILRTSHMKSPSRISPETIINLAENGVPHQVFIDLMKAGVAMIIKGLTTWDTPDAMYQLWLNVERAGAVCFARRAREAAGEARVRGFGDRHTDEDDDDEDDDEERPDEFDKALDQRSSAWWADHTSGCPSSLEETVMVLLDSGFTPQDSPILREKLKQVVTTKVRTRTQNYRYDVELSASAFVIPDRSGVLGPDEIQIKSSRRNLKNAEGLLTDIIVGDVLMTRNPCKVPTDVRKVKAVEYPELRDYVDIIVCTVQGHRRLLDFLAGGDYDGDTAVVIWSPDIVHPFQNADEKYSVEPAGLGSCFHHDNEQVDTFLQRTASHSPDAKLFEVQSFLLGSLRDTTAVAQYSSMHDNAVHDLGYAHPRTIKLAYKFCKVLDGAKTGLRIKQTTLSEDLRQYHHYTTLGPEWKNKKTTSSIDKSNLSYLPRGTGTFIHGPSVMDVLLAAAKKECKRALSRVDGIFSSFDIQLDPDLVRPWDDATQMAERGNSDVVKIKRRDLSRIAEHVQAMYTEHRTKLSFKEGNNGVLNMNTSSKRTSFTKLPIEVRQDVLRALSKKFASRPHLDTLESLIDEATIARLRASYAYKYDAQKRSTDDNNGWSRFPWDVAMRELCAIKARALGPNKTVTTGFYEKFKLSGRR